MVDHLTTIETPDGVDIEALILATVWSRQPALLILPTIFGINDPMKEIAQVWADRGYLVAVADYFHRSDPGALEITDEGRKAAFARWQALNPLEAIADLRSVKAHLLSLESCNGSLLVLGLCAGGELAFLASTHLDADVAVGYHPTHVDRHLDEVASIEGRVSLHFGANDSLVSMSEVDRIRKATATSSRVEVFVYPGAEHGFTVPGMPSYQEAAAHAADRHTAQLFAQFK